MRNRSLAILDAILEDETNFDIIRNPVQFQNICVAGFSVGHPACVNWIFPQLAVKKWPEDIRTWYTYAKFVAIYPEETYILMGIGSPTTPSGSWPCHLSGDAISNISKRWGRYSLS